MLTELPTLCTRVVDTEPWHFRRLPLAPDEILDSEIESIRLEFCCNFDTWRSATTTKANISLEIPGKNHIHSHAVFTRRGRWRPHYPMGGITFSCDGKHHRYHLIIRQPEDVDHGKLGEMTDLSMEELFAGETWNYRILNSITNVCLRTHSLSVSLSFSDRGEIHTQAIVAEDISLAQFARGQEPSDLEEGAIEAVDLFNLQFLQSLIGNADYFFDYNEQSRFTAHNVAAFRFGHRLVPFPYDIQFSVVLTPRYQRHRHFSLEQEAQINAEAISFMIQRIPHATDIRYIDQALTQACSSLEKAEMHRRLQERYMTYIRVFSESLTRK